MQDIVTYAQISQTLQSQLLHVLQTGGTGAAGDYALAEMLPTCHAADTVAALRDTAERWDALQLPAHAILDILRIETGTGMALVLRRLPMPICMSLRTAMHEGVRGPFPQNSARTLHAAETPSPGRRVDRHILQVSCASELFVSPVASELFVSPVASELFVSPAPTGMASLDYDLLEYMFMPS